MEKMKKGELRDLSHVRLSGFDWLLLCVLIAVMIGIGAFAWIGVHRGEEKEGVLYYTVLISGMDETLFGEAMREDRLLGKTVRSENGTATLGEVTRVERADHTKALAEKNVVKFVTVSNRADYYITVRCVAEDKGAEGIRAQDIRIAAGEIFHLRVGEILTKGALVIDVEWEEYDGNKD